jgi:hypothetical protein
MCGSEKTIEHRVLMWDMQQFAHSTAAEEAQEYLQPDDAAGS